MSFYFVLLFFSSLWQLFGNELSINVGSFDVGIIQVQNDCLKLLENCNF